MSELYTAVKLGVWLGIGIGMLTAASLFYIFTRKKQKLTANKNKVVIITGCDSGLGFSLAQHAADCGFTVIATFLSLTSKGSCEIKRLYKDDIIQIHLDITDTGSIRNAVQTIEHYFEKNPIYALHALVNNAGVMVFGEFEWQTERLIYKQITVNLAGTLMLTNAFCSLIRKHKGRIITVSSHCALANLPGLAVYGATKAALSSWSDGLRVEMAKYGVKVITFIPGSFTTESNIMGQQLQNVKEMHDNFTKEQHRFYSSYFKRYNKYLSFISPPPEPQKFKDKKLFQVFEATLLDKHPDAVYKHEPFRYKYYHLLFKYSPVALRDFLVVRFMKMPEYKNFTSIKDLTDLGCDCDYDVSTTY